MATSDDKPTGGVELQANEAQAEAHGGPARLVPGLDVRVGQVISGKYRVEALLGTSAFGVSCAGTEVQTGAPVTLKFFASYTEEQERVADRRRAKTHLAAELRGEHLVAILDIGAVGPALSFVATERPKGHALDEELEARGRLPYPEAVRWILEACEGLAEGHGAGLVHGDLKPSNLLLAEPKARAAHDARGRRGASERRTLKILDFGMTNAVEALGDQSMSAFFGSPAYLSPEQIQEPHRVGVRADIWALGVILHELISGALPFSAESVSGVMVSVVFDAPALLTCAPYDLARIANMCLSKAPEDRPGDVAELARALAPFADRGGEDLADRVERALSRAKGDASGLRRHPAHRRLKELDDSLAPTTHSPSPAPLNLRPGWKTKQSESRDKQRDPDATQPSARVRRRRTGQWVMGLGFGLALVLGLAVERRRSAARPYASADVPMVPTVGDAGMMHAMDPAGAQALTVTSLEVPDVPVDHAPEAEPSNAGPSDARDAGTRQPPAEKPASTPHAGRTAPNPPNHAHGRPWHPKLVRTPPWPEPRTTEPRTNVALPQAMPGAPALSAKSDRAKARSRPAKGLEPKAWGEHAAKDLFDARK